VITIGGIYGTVRNVDMDGVVTLEIASGVKIRVHKDGINPVASPVGDNK
jgi:preprotein translocase subunit YajC